MNVTLMGWSLTLVGILIMVTGLDQHVIWALIMSVGIGAAVGIFVGYLVAKVGIPSFIVTLALFLAWQGVVLFALNGNPIGSASLPLHVAPLTWPPF